MNTLILFMLLRFIEIQSAQIYIMIEPIAFLILSNLPGQNKLKNMKFFMGLGDNIIGSDSRCQIVLPQRYEMPSYMGNIRIGHNFITIQSFHPYLFYVQANLHRHSKQKQVDNFFPMQIKLQYVPKLGEFFYMGRIKCLIDTPTLEQFSYMRNIANSHLFKLQPIAQILQQSHCSQIKKQRRHNQALFTQEEQSAINKPPEKKYDLKQKKEKDQYKQDEDKSQQFAMGNVDGRVDQQMKSNTQLLDQQNYQVQATLLLQDGIADFEPTINLQEPIDFASISRPIQKQHHYSQEHLLNEIRKEHPPSNNSQHRPQIEDDQFSMPDTIVDKGEPEGKNKPMFQLVESKSEHQEANQQLNDEDEMPATIKQDENEQILVNRMAQTSFAAKKKNEARLYKSDFVGKESNISQPCQDQGEIQDFQDLFGDKEIMLVSALNHHRSELEVHCKSTAIKHIHSLNEPPIQKPQLIFPNTQKIESGKHADESGNQIKKDELQGKKVHIIGFKPTFTHRQYLKKRNLQLVKNADEEFDILLVKQPIKIANRLLLALIQNKRIESEQWIFNKETQIQSKIHNMGWRQIYDKRGTQSQLLKGKGLFYISKRLEELFEKVIECMGGKLVTELVDKKKVTNVILRVQDSVDTDLYLKHRGNKKWRFLKSEVIIDAIFLGKYNLDQKYIIDIFQDQ